MIDISNPESPQIVGSVDTPGDALGVAISGTHAYVTDWRSGLQVIDITNPESPQIVGTVDTPSIAYGVAISDTHAYIADGFSGLQVIDISNPESSQIVGSVDTPSFAYGVAISGTHAYVADGSGLQVIDITNPESPQIVGSVDTPSHAGGVAISGTLACVADGSSGLQILPTQCDDTTGIGEDDLDPDPTDTPQPLVRLSVHPNPFNPRTTVSFSIDQPQNVELCIFDMTGKRIAVLADRAFQAGTHSMSWQGRDLRGRAVASGTYLLRVITDGGVTSEKMMLVR